MNEVNASIITIGDELLIGQTIDTNSAFIAQELNKIGVWVRRRIAIADDRQAILDTLAEEATQSQIIIITGGLGPTADDITKPTLCEYFHTKLIVDKGALQNVTTIFQRLGRSLTERNAKQAEVPENCTVLPNHRGTAPGMWFEAPSIPQGGRGSLQPSPVEETGRNKSLPQSGERSAVILPLEGRGAGRVVYVSLPGVPHEMKGLITDSVLPKIKKTFTLPAVVHRTLLTAGQGESGIADRLVDFEATLPSFIKLAYLPAFGMVRLGLTGRKGLFAVSVKHLPAEPERLQIPANKALLAIAFNNIIGNAYKFSDNQRVQCDLYADSSQIIITIIDSGIGIPLAEQERVFESFYRGTNVKNHPGSGIGLYITGKIIQLYNGRIDVKSEPGNGTTFTITFETAEKISQ